MAELADALDSGSSGHCARAGSSPVIRSFAEAAISRDVAVFCMSKNPQIVWGSVQALAE